MTKHVLIVRHPETEANAARRYVGTGDEPYTEAGETQAAKLVLKLRVWAPDAVYSSPLPRALRVAEPAAAPGAPVILEGLAEMDFGALEGLTYEEAERAGVPLDHLGGPAAPVAPGAEPWDTLAARVSDAGRRILAAPADRLAVVTHGGVVRVLLVEWLGLPAEAAWRFAVPNACTATLRLDQGFGVLESLEPASRE